MKRSEMLYKLYAELVLYTVGDDLYKMANNILTSIEDAGMIPPLLHESLDNDFGDNIHGDIYEWEEE